jgi:ATP-binding cassette subfamily F protein uup
VVTSTIAYEGDANWREYEGGVSDWLIQTKRASDIAAAQGKTTAKPFNYEREQLQKQEQAAAKVSVASPNSPPPASPPPASPRSSKSRKLSFKEQRELDALPETIAALEAEQQDITQALADGSMYASDPARAAALASRSAEIDDALMQALERWELLGA